MRALNVTVITTVITVIIVHFSTQHVIVKKLMENVIRMSFNVTNCLHVIAGNGDLDNYLISAFESLQVSFVVTKTQTEFYKQIMCDGYVILGETLDEIQALFDKRSRRKFTFRAHNRILISSNHDLPPLEVFEDSVNLEGMDILLLKGVSFPVSDTFLLPGLNPTEITLMSVRDRNVIFKWHPGEDFDRVGTILEF